jgi:hypothetical protein
MWARAPTAAQKSEKEAGRPPLQTAQGLTPGINIAGNRPSEPIERWSGSCPAKWPSLGPTADAVPVLRVAVTAVLDGIAAIPPATPVRPW